jgi:hypothetical protein
MRYLEVEVIEISARQRILTATAMLAIVAMVVARRSKPLL